MLRRVLAIDRLARIRGEYLAASAALGLLEARLRIDPSTGADEGWSARDARSWRSNIEATFTIRAYALFEAELREFWLGYLRRKSQPPMKDLLAAITAIVKIPGEGTRRSTR